MRYLKRGFLLCLIPVLLLSQGSVFSQSGGVGDAAETKYEKAINTLYDLHVINGYEDQTFRPLTEISRAEVSQLIVNLQRQNQMAAIASGDTPFTDVPAAHWASGAINLSNQLGIMKGNTDGTFGPGRTVTYAELVKTLVTVLGYEKEAVQQGGYPDGYLKVAASIGLDKDVKQKNTDPLNRGTAAMILYNALYIDRMEQTEVNGSLEYAVVKGNTLEAGLKAEESMYADAYSKTTGSVAYAGGAAGGGGGSVPGYSAGAIPPVIEEEPRVYHNTEEYSAQEENGYKSVSKSPTSTFGIDVDTASYSNVRRMIEQGALPTKDAVRIEEFINYFSYDYPKLQEDVPFSIYTEVSECPWNSKHNLALISLKGKEIDMSDLPPNNFVFLIDISGSMFAQNKLPLLKESLIMLAEQLRPQDKISIVVYASTTGVYLDSISGEEKETIKTAISNLKAGGSTAGASGISLAYKIAKKNFNKEGNNRIILGTDGDFNVGASSESALLELIEKNRDFGIYLSVLGFGMGNIKDNKMELLADKGNGNYAYIDSVKEAQKVLVEQASGTLYTIAKDVKLQVEFNPGKIKEYRLIGYENRLLSHEDFNDDKKDAGELGAGHVVTALYELVMADSGESNVNADDLVYQSLGVIESEDWMTVKFRYKEPDDSESKLIIKTVSPNHTDASPSDNFRFASSVAEFGLLLKNSAYKANASFENVISRAAECLENDKNGYRAGFIELAKSAKGLSERTKSLDD